jgi:hypothetical protein
MIQLFNKNFTLVIQTDYMGISIDFPTYHVRLSTFAGFKIKKFNE